MDRCLIAGRAFWFHLWKLLWPSNLMFVYPRWEINATVWWQYLFPLAVLGLLGILWSLRRWSRAPLAGVLVYIVLLLPSLGFLNIYFFHLFVCSRSLAIPGLPGNHHALRQWDRPAGRTIETLASLARTLEPLWCWPEHCSCSPRSKAGCIATSKRFIGRLSPVILLVGWRTVTLVTFCTRPTEFRRQWICLGKSLRIKPADSTL